jgi:hypothetical protein
MRWAQLLGGGTSWWYLVDETGKIHLAKHSRDMTTSLWNLAKNFGPIGETYGQ